MMPLWTTASRERQSTWGWALASEGRPWVAHRVCPMPSVPHIAVSSSGGLEGRAVELDGDASPEQVHRDHEQALLVIHPDHDSFDVGERSPGDAHALALAEVRVGKHRQSGADESLYGVDRVIGTD